MSRLTLSLLGSFQVTLDGQPVTAFESDKARALLAYLAVESDRPHSREKLAGLLWPDSSEGPARASLSQALSNLRHALADRQADPPAFLVSRHTIQFNRDCDAFVDVKTFVDLSGQVDLTGLEHAVSLYHGRFLEGLSLPDCAGFEEWLRLEQEHLHRLAADTLARLAAVSEEEGNFERALAFTWQLLELDPWRESIHRQAMRLLAHSGRRDAAMIQYQTCCRLLADHLTAEPSRETVRLYEQIRDGQLPVRPQPPLQAAGHPALPGFLTDQPAPFTTPVFVAREQELAWLGELLERALSQRGQAGFVVGGPGRGKTALLHEFARRALDAHSDLLVAMGTCNAYAGVGDPYLPFRGVLAMLAGDAEAAWATGILSASQARRMWAALPEAAPLLARWGSGLVGTLLPGQDLLERAHAIARSGKRAAADWLPQLERLADPRTNPPGGLEQSHLFEQFANVLVQLSLQHPLLVILDDLQWADLASIGLLFHLGRRIGAGRILLVGAYRPHELATGRDGQRHPLEPALAELRARIGAAWYDLAAADEAEGRLFVDRFLDSEPNALDQRFRQALFGRTRGHALFTIELLRAMQERGDLVQDRAGRWAEGRRLAWDRLPARAEAAVAQRIDRLPEDLREILAAASVEGEEFSAQTVALALDMDELRALRILRRQLAVQHRLVREQGEVRLGRRSLSRYRFSHFLFQQHLYQGLGESERRLLHHRVGEALERLYEGRLEEIAVELARHFAGDPEREQRYTRLAGERAAAQFANEEAARYISRALELTPGHDLRERYELLLVRERAHDFLGQREAQQQDFAEMEELVASGLGLSNEEQAEQLLRMGQARWRTLALAEAAQQFDAALALARTSGDRRLEAQALGWLGATRYFQYARADAERFLREGLAIAQEAGDEITQALSARMLGILAAHQQERHDEARHWLELARALSENAGDRRWLADTLRSLAFLAIGQEDWDNAKHRLGDALALAEETGDRFSAAQTLRTSAGLAYARAAFQEARACCERAATLAEEIGDNNVVMNSLEMLGWLACTEGAYDEAGALLKKLSGLCDQVGDRVERAYAQARLACVLVLQRQQGAGWALLVQELGELRDSELSTNTVPNIVGFVGQLAVRLGRFKLGAELLGLSFRRARSRDFHPEGLARPEMDLLRAALGPEELEAALARGAALDLDQVVAEILACETPEAYWGPGLEGTGTRSDQC